MSGVRKSDINISRDGQSPNPYQYTAGFIRTYWAWAYLRRNPRYRLAYSKFRDEPAHPEAADWSLVRFEDPDFDGRVANVFWQRQACRHVLPLTASAKKNADGEGHYFSLERLRCRVTSHRDADHYHILFAENGCSLQLEISGAFDLEKCVLFAPVLPPPRLRAARLLAVRRLSDLMTHGTLRPALYPPERRAARLMRVLQALDGSLAGASHRDIGIALFGEARIDRDWHHPHNYLRDHVRRAIAYGRALMEGGYRKLLR
jgi:hypothetical protein